VGSTAQAKACAIGSPGATHPATQFGNADRSEIGRNEWSNTMLALKYLLMILGVGLFGSASALVVYDIFLSTQLRRLLRRNATEETGAEVGTLVHRPFGQARWRLALQLAAAGALVILITGSVVVVPDGTAGVRVGQIWGARPDTLYSGVHLVTPLVDSVAIYDTREQVYSTVASENAKQKGDVLTVQAPEGLNVGVAVSVRYRLDPKRLDSIHRNLPQLVGEQVVAPVVATIYRQLAPNYITREIFATKREELRTKAAGVITARLASDGIVVREVLIRDLQLPEEYAKGLEGLPLKEQENERLGTEQEIKSKEVKIAELEPEAQKAREGKQAEAQAQVHVLQAKAESDAMQYTLPLKQKQIAQSKLEAEARKESTLQNAEAAAQAKIIDSKAEIERQKNLADAEANRIRVIADANANRIRVTAAADAERMKFEAAVLKSNPMLIQKIIERLSDKLQIMMVPMDGKNFFASDVMRSAFSKAGSASSDDGSDDAAPTATASAQKRQPKRP
jgi:regulator of protease activity HflC (stomatin/prohibitin superfamily)